MNRKLILKIALVLILLFLVAAAVSMFATKKESFSDITFPPNSLPELRNREPVDRNLKKRATVVKGTTDTPIYIIDGFLDDAECTALINSAAGKMKASPLTRPVAGDKYYRTSETGYFDGTGIQNDIDARIYELVGRPNWSAEKTQLQHYTLGKEFKQHNDAFDKEHDKEFWEKGQRTWTCMIYLNNVDQGGTTNFPAIMESLVPKKGRAVVWSSLNSDGSIDRNTTHRGTPVEKGEKWITTTWFRDSRL
jgi:prolyl 4-hydroxylase